MSLCVLTQGSAENVFKRRNRLFTVILELEDLVTALIKHTTVIKKFHR